jgi:hypothetical protein
MSVFPAKWEAEMGESRFEANPSQKVSETSPHTISKTIWSWWYMPVIPGTQEMEVGVV